MRKLVKWIWDEADILYMFVFTYIPFISDGIYIVIDSYF